MSMVLVVAKGATRTAVCAELAARGIPHVLLDLTRFSRTPKLEARLDRNKTGTVSARWTGTLRTGGGVIALEDVTGIYWDIPLRIVSEPIAGVLGALDCRWVNDPVAVVADTWPRRQRRAARCFPANGFVITNDKVAARELTGRPRRRHYFYAERVRTSRVIHFFVVGQRVFAVAVFEGRELVFDVPERLGSTLSSYVTFGGLTGLTYSAVTFGKTDDGLWIYIGSDPTADWTSYADRFGLPIAAAIVDELISG